MTFKDIPKFTDSGHYMVNIPIMRLDNTLRDYKNDYNLELCPDFQRGHVWTRTQQEKWLEFFFRGGVGANTIRFNCPEYGQFNESAIKPNDILETNMVCVDGLQRLSAMLAFLHNEIQLFGNYLDEFEDKPDRTNHNLIFNINGLQTRREVLQWYIDINSGGIVHTDKEIERVRELLMQAHK